MVRKKREREMEIGQFVVYMKCHNMGSTRGWESAGVKRKGKGIRGLEQSGELALEKGQKCQEQQQKQRPIHPSALWNASRAGRRNVICGQSKFKAKAWYSLLLSRLKPFFLSLSFTHSFTHTFNTTRFSQCKISLRSHLFLKSQSWNGCHSKEIQM